MKRVLGWRYTYRIMKWIIKDGGTYGKVNRHRNIRLAFSFLLALVMNG